MAARRGCVGGVMPCKAVWEGGCHQNGRGGGGREGRGAVELLGERLKGGRTLQLLRGLLEGGWALEPVGELLGGGSQRGRATPGRGGGGRVKGDVHGAV